MTDPVSADTTTDTPSPDTAAAAAPLPGAPKPGIPRPAPAKPGGGPRPGGLKPGSTPSHHSAPAITAPTSDPSKFGRVDEDGSAWVTTAEGERQIGSWQAGDAAEGLAHFGRRYDDLVTEVTLLEARLASGSGDAKKTKAAASALSASIPTASVIGDLDAVLTRLAAIIEHSDAAAAAAKIARDEERAKHTARKEELALEAEAIGSESTQWKVAGDRLRQILDEWKTIRGVDRKVDDALWKRYSKARENFNRRRGAHFADLDRERGAAKTRKEELVEQAKALSTSTDWAETSAAFRELLNEWKAAGRAPRDADDTLWKNFKGAQDVFFQARNEAATERDAEFDGNAAAKEALLAKFGSIDPDNGMDAARASLRDLQDQWDAIGKVPREKMQELEGKLRAIEKRVRDAVDSQWRRSDPEAVARAAQFRERATQFEEQANKATAAGKTKDAQKAAEQAQQWREWADAAEEAIDGR